MMTLEDAVAAQAEMRRATAVRVVDFVIDRSAGLTGIPGSAS